jgi:hypothetical protein
MAAGDSFAAAKAAQQRATEDLNTVRRGKASAATSPPDAGRVWDENRRRFIDQRGGGKTTAPKR